MSTTAAELMRPAAGPARVGQGTAVEQSRAIAEVQAQVIVAQQMPRDITRANRDMMRSCAMKSLAEKAFYRYSRGGSQISGASVQLARELARCWGNIQYGITELRRDDEHGQSEMLAFAWDLETNTRSATTFIVQHVRDVGRTAKLTEQRDIYENNANNGARRLREMIFAILPGWYTEDAVSACYATLAADESDGGTAAERAANAVARFAKIGVTPEQLAQKVGAPQARWSPSDLAQLAVIWKSVERSETTAEAEFGPSPARVTAAEVTAQAADKPARARTAAKPKTAEPATPDSSPAPAASAPATAAPPQQQGAGEDPPPPAEPDPTTSGASSSAPAPDSASRQQTAAPSPSSASSSASTPAQRGQIGMIQQHLERLGMAGDDQRDARLRAVARLARVPALASSKDLTSGQAAAAIRALSGLREAHELAALLDDIAIEMDGDPRDGEANGE